MLGGSESKRGMILWLSRHYRIVLFDKDPQCPLRHEAHSFHPHGFEDVDSISTALSDEDQLAAIVSYSAHPAALRTTACLSAYFNLPANPPHLVDATLDKAIWPRLALNTGFALPEQSTITEYLQANDCVSQHDGYVLKRRKDTHGGRDVHYAGPLHDHLASLSRNEQDQFLMQRRVIGNEYSVDAGISKSRVHTLSITRKRTRQGSAGVKIVSLSALDEESLPASEEANLLMCLQSLVENCGIETSVLSLDVIHSGHTFFLIDMGFLLDMKVDAAWCALGHNPYAFLTERFGHLLDENDYPKQLRGWKLVFEYREDDFSLAANGSTQLPNHNLRTSRIIASETIGGVNPLDLQHTWLVQESDQAICDD